MQKAELLEELPVFGKPDEQIVTNEKSWRCATYSILNFAENDDHVLLSEKEKPKRKE